MNRRLLLTAAAVLQFGAVPLATLAQDATAVVPPAPAAAEAPAAQPGISAAETHASTPSDPAPIAVPEMAPVAALPAAALPVGPVADPAAAVLESAPVPAKPKAPAVRPIKDPPPKTSWPIADRYYPTEVSVRPELAVGTIIIVSDKYFLYHVVAPGKAMRYGVAVGRDELKFRGKAYVARKVRWPSWTPTPEMIQRNPGAYKKYQAGMPGGPGNPLGARALYLYQDGRDTSIRIHGTTEPSSIGHAVSNGCLRMVNDHVIALFDTVPVGTPVIVY
jgi:lipoprotein-anchoring transpeptidase ErfK/SrfK